MHSFVGVTRFPVGSDIKAHLMGCSFKHLPKINFVKCIHMRGKEIWRHALCSNHDIALTSLLTWNRTDCRSFFDYQTILCSLQGWKIHVIIEAVCVTSRVPTRWRLSLLLLWLRNWGKTVELRGMLICVLHIIGCVMSKVCHAEREYPQDGGRGKKADSLMINCPCFNIL